MDGDIYLDAVRGEVRVNSDLKIGTSETAYTATVNGKDVLTAYFR